MKGYSNVDLNWASLEGRCISLLYFKLDASSHFKEIQSMEKR